jgi:hypothetical protein
LSKITENLSEIKEMIKSKINAENAALAKCREFCSGRRIGLYVETISTEFQFDRKKLTIFIKKTGEVSVCKLVRKLYDAFKMRISVEEVPSMECVKETIQKYLDLSQLGVPVEEVLNYQLIVQTYAPPPGFPSPLVVTVTAPMVLPPGQINQRTASSSSTTLSKGQHTHQHSNGPNRSTVTKLHLQKPGLLNALHDYMPSLTGSADHLVLENIYRHHYHTRQMEQSQHQHRHQQSQHQHRHQQSQQHQSQFYHHHPHSAASSYYREARDYSNCHSSPGNLFEQQESPHHYHYHPYHAAAAAPNSRGKIPRGLDHLPHSQPHISNYHPHSNYDMDFSSDKPSFGFSLSLDQPFSLMALSPPASTSSSSSDDQLFSHSSSYPPPRSTMRDQLQHHPPHHHHSSAAHRSELTARNLSHPFYSVSEPPPVGGKELTGAEWSFPPSFPDHSPVMGENLPSPTSSSSTPCSLLTPIPVHSSRYF